MRNPIAVVVEVTETRAILLCCLFITGMEEEVQ